jgi:hypothetical protein
MCVHVHARMHVQATSNVSTMLIACTTATETAGSSRSERTLSSDVKTSDRNSRKQLGVGSCPFDPCLRAHVHGSPLYGHGPAWVWPGCIRLGLYLTCHMLACRAACFKHSHGWPLQFTSSCVCEQQNLGPNLLPYLTQSRLPRNCRRFSMHPFADLQRDLSR